MKKFKKCFSALFLSCFLAFGNISGCYLEVQAFEWTAPETFLPFDGALPYLMGLLGVFPKDKSTFNPEQWKDDYIADLESQGFDVSEKSDFGEWVENISKGALDQSSVYWEKFKEWLTKQLTATSGDSVVSGELSAIVNSIPNLSNINYSPSSISSDVIESSFGYYYVDRSSGQIEINIWSNQNLNDISFTKTSTGFKVYYDYSNFAVNYRKAFNINRLEKDTRYSSLVNNTSISYNSSVTDNCDCYFFGVPAEMLQDFSNFHVWNIMSSNPSQDIFVSLDPSIIDSLSLALSSAISDAIPGVIPLPWDNVGANEDELEDEYDAILEGIQAGSLDIPDAMEKLQDLLGLLTVSDTGKIYPENPDKPDETLQDKAEENQANGGFVLSGLEKVFPFCIPFDLYAFMTLLVAEPVAPVINWPIYNPISGNNEIITIDFSTWQSVVVLFRYIFDFLFIIGLLLMARALIGGGDSA